MLTDNTLFGVCFLHNTPYRNQSLPNHGDEMSEEKTICKDMLGWIVTLLSTWQDLEPHLRTVLLRDWLDQVGLCACLGVGGVA